VFYKRKNKEGAIGIDILKGEAYDSPQNLWGDEDYIWSLIVKKYVYVAKKKERTHMPPQPIQIYINTILKPNNN
jgi:hypothetical protein